MVVLAYSVVGSTALLFGVQILLLGIGFRIVSKLPQTPWVLPSIFGGLVMVGWVNQAFLGKPAKGKAKAPASEQDGGDDDCSDDEDADGDE